MEQLIGTWQREAQAALTVRQQGMEMELYKVVAERRVSTGDEFQFLLLYFKRIPQTSLVVRCQQHLYCLAVDQGMSKGELKSMRLPSMAREPWSLCSPSPRPIPYCYHQKFYIQCRNSHVES